MPSVFLVLAFLIGDSTGSFAGRLAGRLAFAASALACALLQGSAVERLDMFHTIPLLCVFVWLHYTTSFFEIQWDLRQFFKEAANAKRKLE